ncbi:MAG: hypothetical protein PHC62_00435 [Candidatus Izemoplasmatales bacterium]|nr:hypothetical protein [Candidatus Izemoplasmatales bacterium]
MGEYLGEQVRTGRINYEDAVRMYPEYKPEIDRYLEEYTYIEIEN